MEEFALIKSRVNLGIALISDPKVQLTLHGNFLVTIIEICLKNSFQLCLKNCHFWLSVCMIMYIICIIMHNHAQRRSQLAYI